MSAHTKHDDLPPEAFGVELDPLPPWAREEDAAARADRVIHTYETEARGEMRCADCNAVFDHGGGRCEQHDAPTVRAPALPPDAAALVEACEARAAKATEGPIDVHRFDNEGGSISWQLQQQVRPRSAALVLCEFDDCENRRARFDAEFYANARTDVPALCALVRAQQGEIDGLRSTIATLDAEYVRELTEERDEALCQVVALGREREALRDAHARERAGLLGDVQHARAEQAKAERERDVIKTVLAGGESHYEVERRAKELEAIVERMKPVVEAAEIWRQGGDRGELKAAVDAYSDGQSATTERSDLRGLPEREAQ